MYSSLCWIMGVLIFILELGKYLLSSIMGGCHLALTCHIFQLFSTHFLPHLRLITPVKENRYKPKLKATRKVRFRQR